MEPAASRASSFLENAGGQVRRVRSLAEARSAFAEGEYVLVLVGEPADCSGLDAARALAAFDTSRVLWTSAAWFEAHYDAAREAAEEVLETEASDLVSRLRIQGMIARHHGERERQQRHELGQAVRRLCADLPATADRYGLLRHAVPRILDLPGVVGVYGALLDDACAPMDEVSLGSSALPPPESVRAACAGGERVVVELGAERLEVLPLGRPALGVLSLRARPDCPRGGPIDAVGVAMGAGLTCAAALEAACERGILVEQALSMRAGQLARVQARLAAFEGDRDNLLSVLGHDVRTPISVILGHAQLLEEGLVPEHQRARSFAVVRRQCERLTELTEDLLERQRERGLTPVGRDLGEIVREMIREWTPWASRHGWTLAATGAHDAPVDADPTLVGAVLDRVMQYALGRARAGADVEVRCLLAADDVEATFFGDFEGGGGAVLADVAAGTSAPLLAELGGVIEPLPDEPGRAGLTVRLPRAPLGGGGVLLLAPGAASHETTGPGPAAVGRVGELLGRVWDVRVGVPDVPLAALLKGTRPETVVVWAGRDLGPALGLLRALRELPWTDLPPVVVLLPPDAVEGGRAALAEGAFALVPDPCAGEELLATVRRARATRTRARQSYEARALDLPTGLETAETLLQCVRALAPAARAAGAPLPAIRVEGLRLRGEETPADVREPLLAWFAGELRRRALPGDLLARSGPDAVTLLLPGRSMEGAVKIRDDLRELLYRARPKLVLFRRAVEGSLRELDLTSSGARLTESRLELTTGEQLGSRDASQAK